MYCFIGSNIIAGCFHVEASLDKNIITLRFKDEVSNETEVKTIDVATLPIQSMHSMAQNKFGKHTDFVDISKIILSRDTLNLFSLNNYTDGREAFKISLYKGDTNDEICLISFYPTIVRGNHIVQIISEAKAFSGFIEEVYPKSKPMFDYWTVKKRLLLELDPNQSLAYLEGQLDILTAIVIEFLDAQPAIKSQLQKAIDIEAFQQIYSRTSLLNIKAMDRCLNEMALTKGRIRQLQTDYYQAKNK